MIVVEEIVTWLRAGANDQWAMGTCAFDEAIMPIYQEIANQIERKWGTRAVVARTTPVNLDKRDVELILDALMTLASNGHNEPFAETDFRALWDRLKGYPDFRFAGDGRAP